MLWTLAHEGVAGSPLQKFFHPALPTLCFVSIRFLTDPSVGDDAVRRLRVPVEFSYLSPRVLPPPTGKKRVLSE